MWDKDWTSNSVFSFWEPKSKPRTPEENILRETTITHFCIVLIEKILNFVIRIQNIFPSSRLLQSFNERSCVDMTFSNPANEKPDVYLDVKSPFHVVIFITTSDSLMKWKLQLTSISCALGSRLLVLL